MNALNKINMDGNIFGIALNYKCLYQKLQPQFSAKPYIHEPKKPVLFIKTPNTRNYTGQPVFKKDADILQAGPTLGIVIGKSTRRVTESEALQHIAAYVVVNELSLPEESYYRPAIKAKCQDGFCVLGTPVAKEQVSDLNDLGLRVYVNDELKQHSTTANWLRTPAQLIAEISEYMPLNQGDIILTGTPLGRVDVQVGDQVRVEIDQLGAVSNLILSDTSEAAILHQQQQTHPERINLSTARTARIRYQEQIYQVEVLVDATDADAALQIKLPSGELLQEHEVEWLAPTTGNMFALGLNYADHARELAFEPPKQPLIFIKAPNTYTGHRSQTWRPNDVEYMHYECELVAVIGKVAKNVKREDALAYIAGYTLCNDYAIRDFLENYYRPNLRVKNRDCTTPVGPYLIDQRLVPTPNRLSLKTWVNGELRQQGTTADMIFDVPFLIEYLSSFMTLQPGDMIATGTPEGLSDVVPGDEVVVEIEGVGKLRNFIVSEAAFYKQQA